jgi:glycosyltransferase involved in cell wall biosynthesis
VSAAVVAVVVSHNRRELLTECLTALGAQTRRPDAVVVVDNASSDGSADLVRESFPEVDLVSLGRNTGGAGGFAAGLAEALEVHGADLVWLMDDDTVPTPDALAELLRCWRDHPGRPALVASRVVWGDGRDHPMNTPRRRPGATAQEVEDARRVDAEPVRSASFVSVLVDGAAVRSVGLPQAAYFIWNDDFEFTTRLLRDRTGLASRRSVVVHKTRTFGSVDADPGPRFRFEVRNKLWLFTRSGGLSPAEKVVYGGATLVRWARTVRRSSDRRTLLRAGVRGMAEGLRAGPRSTPSVLAGLGSVSEHVRAVDLKAAR